VKGYGETKSIWAQDWVGNHTRIEIFAEKNKADVIAAAIIEVAHTDAPGDGIISIFPVDKIFRIRTKSEVKETDEI
jgi:nitrogen regulatory protein P-II 1